MRSEEIHLVPQLATASTDAFSNLTNAHASVVTVSKIRLSRVGPNINSQLDSLSVGGQLNIRFQCGLRLYHIPHSAQYCLNTTSFGSGLQFSIGFNLALASTPARPLAWLSFLSYH